MGNLVARADPVKVEMASKFIKEAIAKDKVVIFSKTYCPYCTMAKEVSDSKKSMILFCDRICHLEFSIEINW